VIAELRRRGTYLLGASSPSASSTSLSCSAGFTLRRTRETLPFAPITNVVRSLPK
jgi:hypothetical protein